MKVSKQWLQEYLAFELPNTQDLAVSIGSQLGEIDAVEQTGPKYEGAVIVAVRECAPLENSDHLNLCFIDDGGAVSDVTRRDDGLVQVVCGAPNVAAGLSVVWLPPGATVPSTFDTDPFVLGARELRGTMSNGMLASPKELSIGDSHEGLLIIDERVAPGTTFSAFCKLDDAIIDIENKMFTHRPDCFGQLGVAREVAGILGQQFTSPDWYTSPSLPEAGEGLQLRIDNQIPEVVPRFMAVALQGVQLAPSPLWLQTKLSRLGVRPINNVVDITNYIMLLTAQPLHAYDYDKVAQLTAGDGAQLTARYPKADEQLELLSGKQITPRSEAIMIATDQHAVGLGGVMGGANTEVDEATTNIILECATFDMYSIRRTSMAHGLFTDAVTRYNKGQSPHQNPAVLAQAVQLLRELTGASVASEIIDPTPAPEPYAAVTVDASFVNDRLGLALSADEMATILRNVEFAVTVDGQKLLVLPPFWRTDIAIAEDIVEEVGRLYGFDKLPLTLPQRVIAPTPQDALLMQKTIIRDSLAKAGANELLTYSFVHGDLLKKVGQSSDAAFKLSNALSPDLQYYRLSVLPSLLDKVHGNSKAGYDEFALFEIGKGHSLSYDDDGTGVPVEFEDVDFVYASKQAKSGAAYYYARHYLEALTADLHISVSYKPCSETTDDPVLDAFDRARSAQIYVDGSDTPLGVVGEFKRSVIRDFKLPAYCAGFSINQKLLLAARQHAGVAYTPLPKYPKVEQDICLKVPASTQYGDLEVFVSETLEACKPERSRLQTALLDIYQRADDTEHKQITFRVALAHFDKTMTDSEMSRVLDELSTAAGQKFGASRI